MAIIKRVMGYKRLLYISLGLLLSSCSLVEEKRNTGSIVAEYGSHTLSRMEINALTAGMNPSDSACVAEAYIRQWAMDWLEYDYAKESPDKEIEEMIEDYRRSLYVHEYEERLVSQRMPKEVEDSVIESFYMAHQQYFILRETILHGVLLVIPNGAPSMDNLRKWLQDPTAEENIENIEKYAYQYASGYELFLEDWKTANQILLWMPFEKDDFQKQVRQKKQIEMQDSVSTYLLQVTDIHLLGEPTPIDYAYPEIKKIILNKRQADFLRSEREAMYEQALRERKVRVYK